MLEGSKNWCLDELVEVLLVDFSSLEVSHQVGIQGENEFPLGVLPNDGRAFEKECTSCAIAKVLHPDASIRSNSVLLAVNPPDDFGVGVWEAKDAGSKIAGQTKFGDKNENLDPHGVIDIDLTFALYFYLPVKSEFIGSYRVSLDHVKFCFNSFLFGLDYLIQTGPAIRSIRPIF